MSLNPAHDEVYLIQHYMIMLLGYLRHISGFPLGTRISTTNKTDCHDIIEILLKVALNSITITVSTYNLYYRQHGTRFGDSKGKDKEFGYNVLRYLNLVETQRLLV